MFAMTERQPQLNSSQLHFPSDSVTLRDLRLLRIRDRRVDLEDEGVRLMHMQDLEEAFARLSFARAIGAADNAERAEHDIMTLIGEVAGSADQPEGRQALTEHYIRYGVADGPETARQLIRRFEATCVEQAKAQLGEGPA